MYSHSQKIPNSVGFIAPYSADPVLSPSVAVTSPLQASTSLSSSSSVSSASLIGYNSNTFQSLHNVNSNSHFNSHSSGNSTGGQVNTVTGFGVSFQEDVLASILRVDSRSVLLKLYEQNKMLNMMPSNVSEAIFGDKNAKSKQKSDKSKDKSKEKAIYYLKLIQHLEQSKPKKIVFGHLRLAPSRFVLSYKGAQQSITSLQDFEGITIMWDGHTEKKQLLTLDELGSRLLSEVIVSVLRQVSGAVGTFLAYKFGINVKNLQERAFTGAPGGSDKNHKDKKAKKKDAMKASNDRLLMMFGTKAKDSVLLAKRHDSQLIANINANGNTKNGVRDLYKKPIDVLAELAEEMKQ
jgi:hypothetical protein